jgi:ubiquitin carboxyl-terminal hydrolase L5
MATVRPALRLKMSKYGASPTESSSNIRFSLLAIVDDAYESASDDFELAKRERGLVERRLDALEGGGRCEGKGWRGMVSLFFVVFFLFPSFQCLTPSSQVDPTLLSSAPTLFSSPPLSSPQLSLLPFAKDRIYAPDFGARKLERDMKLLRMPKEELTGAWEGCVRAGMRAKVVVEDELWKGVRANVSCYCSFGFSLGLLCPLGGS